MIHAWCVKSVETLGIQEVTALRPMRMWTLSTATLILNRIKDGISNRDRTTKGNYQGNNFNNFNQPPLRELIAGQSKLMEGLSRKVATNDKILENINNRMDSFASAIKN